MNRTELIERITNCENSRVEFKRDNCHPDELATEMAALLNFEGVVVLLGVEDSGRISGLIRSRGDAEEWVMNIVRQNLQPAVIPVWTCIEIDGDKTVGVIELAADSPEKPYKARRGNAWVTFIRVGSTSRGGRNVRRKVGFTKRPDWFDTSSRRCWTLGWKISPWIESRTTTGTS